MLNQAAIFGRLTQDPTLQQVGEGTAYVRFRVAVERDYIQKDGSRPVDFVQCIAWRQTAQFLAKFFQKGSAIVVTGRLETNAWKNAQGESRSETVLHTENIYFGESRRSKEARTGASAAPDTDYGALPPTFDRPYEQLCDEDAQLPF